MLFGNVSADSGGLGGDLLGGLGGLLSPLFGLFGSGSNGTGQVETAGGPGEATVVAPQSYNYGPFGLLQKNIPGAIVAPEATYANMPNPIPLTVPNIQTPQFNPIAMSQSLGGNTPGGYTPSGQLMPSGTASTNPAFVLPAAGGATAPMAPQPNPGLIGNPMYPPQQQGNGTPQASLQGSVQQSVLPAPMAPQGMPFQGQIQALGQGAQAFGNALASGIGAAGGAVLNAAGQLIGGQPAEAATPRQAQAGLAPPPPPYAPSITDMMVPTTQQAQQALNNLKQLGGQATNSIAQRMLTDTHSSMAGLQKDIDGHRKELVSALKKLADDVRAPYKEYAKKRFDTPRPELGGATTRQFRDALEGEAAGLEQAAVYLASPQNPDREQRSRRLLPAVASVASQQRLLASPPPMVQFFGGKNLAAAAATYTDPDRMRAQAYALQYRADREAADDMLKQAGLKRQEAGRFTHEMEDYYKLSSQVEGEIQRIGHDLNQSFQAATEAKLKTLHEQNDAAAGMMRTEMATQQMKMEGERAALQAAGPLAQAQLAAAKLLHDQEKSENEAAMKLHKQDIDQQVETEKLKQHGAELRAKLVDATQKLADQRNITFQEAWSIVAGEPPAKSIAAKEK